MVSAPLYGHVYSHLPFCEVICHYCDFYTARAKTARHEDLFAALEIEAKTYLPQLQPKLTAIYFGGGTPSVTPPKLLHRFLDIFRDRISPETEITMEANPTNVTRENVVAWKKAGINRLSVGIQSLDDDLLKKLGRVHSSQQAKDALATCLSEIENVSGDLIYGVPGQSELAPSNDALEMAKIGVKHFSAYHLTLLPTHFLFPKLPEDKSVLPQIRSVVDELSPLGFLHYEVSNFSLPGFESKNNGNYWRGGPYLALGPSAHGFDGKKMRWKNVADWEKYISLIQERGEAIEEKEELTDEQRRIEIIFTSLRTREGLDLRAFAANFKVDLGARHASLFKAWEKEGLATVANDHFVLTFEGRMLADEIAKKLL